MAALAKPNQLDERDRIPRSQPRSTRRQFLEPPFMKGITRNRTALHPVTSTDTPRTGPSTLRIGIAWGRLPFPAPSPHKPTGTTPRDIFRAFPRFCCRNSGEPPPPHQTLPRQPHTIGAS